MTETECIYLKYCDGCDKHLGHLPNANFEMYCPKCMKKFIKENPHAGMG